MDALSLFHRYRDDVYRLAVNYTRSPEEAEDVSRAVFLKLVEHGELMPGTERDFLMQTTADTCRNLLHSGGWKRAVKDIDLTSILGDTTEKKSSGWDDDWDEKPAKATTKNSGWDDDDLFANKPAKTTTTKNAGWDDDW